MWAMGNTDKLKQHPPPPHLLSFPMLNFTPLLPIPLPHPTPIPALHGGRWGNVDLWSVNNHPSPPLLSPHTFPVLQCMFFLWTTVQQARLLQHGYPTGCRSCKPVSAWAPLSTAPRVLSGACSSVGFPQSHSFLWASTWPSMGSCSGCRWISVSLWSSMGCRHTAASPWATPQAAGESCLEHLLLPCLH